MTADRNIQFLQKSALCQLPGQSTGFSELPGQVLSLRAQLGRLCSGPGVWGQELLSVLLEHLLNITSPKQGLCCTPFLACRNSATLSKLAECSGDEPPPDSYFGGITVLQKDFFLQQRGFFNRREMFSRNADLRSVSFGVAPVWVCSSWSCFPSVGAPVLHLFCELAVAARTVLRSPKPKSVRALLSCESHCKVGFSV